MSDFYPINRDVLSAAATDTVLYFKQNGVIVGRIVCPSGGNFFDICDASGAILLRISNSSVIPGTNDAVPLGGVGNQWSHVYSGAGIFSGYVRTTSKTVATLIAAATAGAGGRSFVSDANTTLAAGVGTTVVGGGANKVPVYSDGTNWLIG